MSNSQPTGLIRYDKNVANDMPLFSEHYAHSEDLVRDLSLFFSYDLQHSVLKEDLFGTKILDPVVFASLSNRKNYRSLMNKVPISEVAQFKTEQIFSKMSQEELKEIYDKGYFQNNPVFVTRLDNALYLMYAKLIVFSKPGKTPKEFMSVELRSMRFLKHLKKIFNPKTKKTLYECEVSDEFMNNLARMFMKLDYNVYNQIPRAYQGIYIYLINYRERVNTENLDSIRVSIDFDHLCKVAGIHEWKGDQREKKRYLNNAFNTIHKAHPNSPPDESFFKVKWERGDTSNFKYVPHFTFSYTEKEKLEAGKVESTNRLKLFLELKLKRMVRELFKDDNSRDVKMKYQRMLTDRDFLYENKHRVAIDTYQLVFGTQPTDIYSKPITRIMDEIIPQLAADRLLREG